MYMNDSFVVDVATPSMVRLLITITQSGETIVNVYEQLYLSIDNRMIDYQSTWPVYRQTARALTISECAQLLGGG